MNNLQTERAEAAGAADAEEVEVVEVGKEEVGKGEVLVEGDGAVVVQMGH